jgi:hypothetical protein
MDLEKSHRDHHRVRPSVAVEPLSASSSFSRWSWLLLPVVGSNSGLDMRPLGFGNLMLQMLSA